MPLPTQDAIVTRIKARREKDFLGFETGDYVEFLDYDHVKEFLKPDHDVAALSAVTPPELTRDNMISKMHGYMAFAWDKANNQRGLSANRSVMHYIAWTWLAGDVEFSQEIERMFEHEYCHYGKPLLEKIAEHYGWDWKQWDNGERTNGE